MKYIHKKKILIISPTPTHPCTAGNRARILHMVHKLLKQGCEVYFMYIKDGEFDLLEYNQLKNFWDDKLLYCNNNKFENIINLFIRRILNKIDVIKAKIIYKATKDQLIYNQFIDWHYNVFSNTKIKRIAKEIRFDIVICEYVALSKYLINFDETVLKIIDTHDIFADRFQVYIQIGQTPEWYSFYKQEETKGLRRSDIVISIQEEEYKYFKKVSPENKHILIGHAIETIFIHRNDSNNLVIGFLASANPINIKSLEYFLEVSWEKLLNEIHNCRLYIAGSICDEAKRFKKYSNIIWMGRVKKIDEFYSSINFIINPMISGTGLKIKTIEAICYGKPIITTKKGASGLKKYQGCFVEVNSIAEFPEAIIKVYKNPEAQKKLFENCKMAANRMLDDYDDSLKKMIDCEKNLKR